MQRRLEVMGKEAAPSRAMAGVPVNDDPALEHEADVMGQRAMQFRAEEGESPREESGNQAQPEVKAPAGTDGTELPAGLKAGIEQLSGMSMDAVEVHYGSDQPAQLNAHAYAQDGTIHVAPGQERHLAHEAWHVVQQRQGRVPATRSLKAGAPAHGDPGPAQLSGTPVAHFVIQRKKYAELTDQEREEVDAKALMDFKANQELFEASVGDRAANAQDAHDAADELLDRTVHLAEAVFFNKEKGYAKTLDEFYGEVFGTKNKTISGSVGQSIQAIREVFFGATSTFREKMSLFYVTLEAEPGVQSPLDKLLLEYSEFIEKDVKPFIKESAPKEPGDGKPVAEPTATPATGATTPVTPVKAFKPEVLKAAALPEYLTRHHKKLYLQRALALARLEIDIERKAHRLAAGKVGEERLTPEEQFQRNQEDEELAIHAINEATGGTLTGTETAFDRKTGKAGPIPSAIKAFVEKTLRSGSPGTGGIEKSKAGLEREMDTHLTKFRNAFGYYKVLCVREWSNVKKETAKGKAITYEQVLKEVETSGDYSVDKEKLIEAILEAASNHMLENALAIKKAKEASGPEPPKVSEAEALHHVLEESQFRPIVEAADALAKREDSGHVRDTSAETFARRRFEGLELYEPTLLNTKKAANDSRKGDSRKDDIPLKERHTKATADSLASRDDALKDLLADRPAKGRVALTMRELQFAFSKIPLKEHEVSALAELTREFVESRKKAQEADLDEAEHQELEAFLFRKREIDVEDPSVDEEQLEKLFFTPESFKMAKASPAAPGHSPKEHLVATLKKEDRLRVGQARLPWMPGTSYWRINEKSPFKMTADELHVLVGATVSGTADRVMRSAKYLGMDSASDLKKLLLACLGWMIPAKDHTFYEIMKATESYLGQGKASPHKELSIDIEYALGRGYDTFLALFPDLAHGLNSPAWYLSRAHKEVLAETYKEKEDQAKDATLRILSDHEEVAYAGEAVSYTIRNFDQEAYRDLTYEWFFIRHEDGKARAQREETGTKGTHQLTKTWMSEGLYKLYCVVKMDGAKGTPIATLRYDQIVLAPKTAAKPVPSEPVKPSLATLPASPLMPIEVVATFTDWEGVTRVLPVHTEAYLTDELTGQYVAYLHVPKSLASSEESLETFSGQAKVPVPIPNYANSEALDLFNRHFRRKRERDALKGMASATLDAVQAWARAQTYACPGSVNLDIRSKVTHKVLKEHYFYVKREGGDDEGAKQVPAYRIQGGDYDSGIKSSVRVVNNRDGEMELTGDAMVWINFGDRGRMVWWLNNRTDRSYAVAFKVTGAFLQKIAKKSVSEEESNAPANAGKPFPIISQDRATHQYAIRQHEESGFASMKELQRVASPLARLVKLFQWKTFDIHTLNVEAMPEGKGTLAMPFNEDLIKEADLEVKLRILDHALEVDASNKDAETLKQALEAELRQLRGGKSSSAKGGTGDPKDSAGFKKWERDYYQNLRKPGYPQLESGDRRTYYERTASERLKIAPELTKTIAATLRAHTGPILDLILSEFQTLDEKDFEAHQADLGNYLDTIMHLAIAHDPYPQIHWQDKFPLFQAALKAALLNVIRQCRKLPSRVFEERIDAMVHPIALRGSQAQGLGGSEQGAGTLAGLQRKFISDRKRVRELAAALFPQLATAAAAQEDNLKFWLALPVKNTLEGLQADLEVLAGLQKSLESAEKTRRTNPPTQGGFRPAALVRLEADLPGTMATTLGGQVNAVRILTSCLNTLSVWIKSVEKLDNEEHFKFSSPLPSERVGPAAKLVEAAKGKADDLIGKPPLEAYGHAIATLTGLRRSLETCNLASTQYAFAPRKQKKGGQVRMTGPYASRDRQIKHLLTQSVGYQLATLDQHLSALSKVKESLIPTKERGTAADAARKPSPLAPGPGAKRVPTGGRGKSLEEAASVGVPPPHAVDYPTGRILHATNSCYLATIVHLFASHNDLIKLLSDTTHTVDLEVGGDPSLRREAQARGLALQQQSNLAQIIQTLRDPNGVVTASTMGDLMKFLGLLEHILTDSPEIGKRKAPAKSKEAIATEAKEKSKAIVKLELDKPVASSHEPSPGGLETKPKKVDMGAPAPTTWGVQQDAAEILVKILELLRPGNEASVEETSTLEADVHATFGAPRATVSRQYAIQLPIIGNIHDLPAALRAYSAQETGIEYAGGTVKKAIKFSQMPEVLILVLKRFDFDLLTLQHGKIIKQIVAPPLLTIPQECLAGALAGQNVRYKLIHFTHHAGDEGGGHYTTFATTGTGEWYKHDDLGGTRSTPSLGHFQDALNTAYIYVYQRVP